MRVCSWNQTWSWRWHWCVTGYYHLWYVDFGSKIPSLVNGTHRYNFPAQGAGFLTGCFCSWCWLSLECPTTVSLFCYLPNALLSQGSLNSSSISLLWVSCHAPTLSSYSASSYNFQLSLSSFSHFCPQCDLSFPSAQMWGPCQLYFSTETSMTPGTQCKSSLII